MATKKIRGVMQYERMLGLNQTHPENTFPRKCKNQKSEKNHVNVIQTAAGGRRRRRTRGEGDQDEDRWDRYSVGAATEKEKGDLVEAQSTPEGGKFREISQH